MGGTGPGIVVAPASRGFDLAVSDRAKDEAVAEGPTATRTIGVARARFDEPLEEGFTPINRWGAPEDHGKAVAATAGGDLPFTIGGMRIHQDQ
jgi:hypothetical protein